MTSIYRYNSVPTFLSNTMRQSRITARDYDRIRTAITRASNYLNRYANPRMFAPHRKQTVSLEATTYYTLIDFVKLIGITADDEAVSETEYDVTNVNKQDALVEFTGDNFQKITAKVVYDVIHGWTDALISIGTVDSRTPTTLTLDAVLQPDLSESYFILGDEIIFALNQIVNTNTVFNVVRAVNGSEEESTETELYLAPISQQVQMLTSDIAALMMDNAEIPKHLQMEAESLGMDLVI